MTEPRLPDMAQVPEEFDALLELLDPGYNGLWLDGEPPLRRILETGVFAGGTLARFARAFPEAVVVGIDPSPAFETPPEGTQVVVGSSHDADVRAKALELLGGRPDFMHIDGDHSFEGVLRDALWACEMDVPLVAFHDARTVGHPEIEVFRLWDVLTAADPDGTFEIFAGDGGYHYGFGVWRRR